MPAVRRAFIPRERRHGRTLMKQGVFVTCLRAKIPSRSGGQHQLLSNQAKDSHNDHESKQQEFGLPSGQDPSGIHA